MSESQGVRRRAVELQPFGGAHGHFRADFRHGRPFYGCRLADIVQQQREIKQAGAVQTLEQRRVIFVRRICASQILSSCSRQTSVCSSAAY